MNLRAGPDPRQSMKALIAFYLRFLRQEKGMTAKEVSAIMGCSESTTSRIETGASPMQLRHAQALDREWRTGGLFEILLYYAERASTPDWFQDLTDREADAARIWIFGGQYVPGLIQTEDYARALLDAGRAVDKDRALKARMGRQHVLRRRNPPELSVILSENALAWAVGGPEVHSQQLERLLELAELPNVILRVVPRTTGAYEGLDGDFSLVESPDGELVAWVEAPGAGRLVTDSQKVVDFRARYERIGAQALPVKGSKELIHQYLEEL